MPDGSRKTIEVALAARKDRSRSVVFLSPKGTGATAPALLGDLRNSSFGRATPF